MPETPNFAPSFLALVANFGVVCSGTVGLVRFLSRWERMQPLQLCLSPSCLGLSFPGWVSFVGEGLRWWPSGHGSHCFFGCVG